MGHVHGQLRWLPTPERLTPVQMAAVADDKLTAEWLAARDLVRDANARARFWVMAYAGALLALLGLMVG